MSIVIDYPRASFRACLALAEAVWYLGGTCSIQNCADRMGLKVSGSFNSLCAAAQKFKLVDAQKGTLSSSGLFKLIKHAYTEEERMENKIKAFLSPPVFAKVYNKFADRELPATMLDKIFIREFQVNPDYAVRLTNYFIDGCKELGILGPGNVVRGRVNSSNEEEADIASEPDTGSPVENPKINPLSAGKMETSPKKRDFSVRLEGPGVDFQLTISDLDDIAVVEGILKMIKRKIEPSAEKKKEENLRD